MAKCPISMIITVNDNEEEKLVHCLNSIISQGSWDFEVIIVNNGSKSESLVALCEGYREKDPRVSVIHMDHSEQADAYNKGLEAAAGRYVHFIDANDQLEEKSLEKVIPLLLQNPDVVFIDTDYYNAPNYWDISHANVLRRLSRSVPDRLWDKLIRRDLLVREDLWFSNGIWESVDFCILLYIHAKVYNAVDFKYYKRHTVAENLNNANVFGKIILTLAKWAGPAESTYEEYSTVIHNWMTVMYCDLLLPMYSTLSKNDRDEFKQSMNDFQWLLDMRRKNHIVQALYAAFGPLGVSYLTRLFVMLILVVRNQKGI